MLQHDYKIRLSPVSKFISTVTILKFETANRKSPFASGFSFAPLFHYFFAFACAHTLFVYICTTRLPFDYKTKRYNHEIAQQNDLPKPQGVSI